MKVEAKGRRKYNENNTVSEAKLQYCRKCYQKGERTNEGKIQGLFSCINPNCNIKEGKTVLIDRNAAFNIAYWALGHISKVGVTVNILELRTLCSIDKDTMITRETSDLNQK